MTTIDSKLSPTEQSNLFLVNIKSAFIRALRSALDDQDYPDRKIQGIKVSMEYPLEKSDYPHIWVEFSFTKFQNSGIGFKFVRDEQVLEEWAFEGSVRFTVVALTSYERDTYASQLMQLLAFSKLNPIASQFDEVLVNSFPNLYISINRDTLTPEGQSVNPGTPWNDDYTYVDSYSIQIIGQIESTFTANPEYVKSFVVESTGFAGNQVIGNPEQVVYGSNGWV